MRFAESRWCFFIHAPELQPLTSGQVRLVLRQCLLDSFGDRGAADIFLEIITQPFLGFDGIVPGSSNQATV